MAHQLWLRIPAHAIMYARDGEAGLGKGGVCEQCCWNHWRYHWTTLRVSALFVLTDDLKVARKGQPTSTHTRHADHRSKFLQVSSPWHGSLDRKHVRQEGYHGQWHRAGAHSRHENASGEQRGAFEEYVSAVQYARYLANSCSSEIPIGRLGTPDEIADTILWMVKTGYVTNKVIAVDGGMFPQ